MSKIKIVLIFLAIAFFFSAGIAQAHQPRIIFDKPAGEIKVENPELSQAFYDELKGEPRVYLINSAKGFNLYINLLVPLSSNPQGRYFADIFSAKDGQDTLIFSTATLTEQTWEQYYEEFGRDYYLKGPEYSAEVPAGEYKIKVYSQVNEGKYVLAVGQTESFDFQSLLNVYWQLPLLKMEFFKTSVLQFFLTPFGIGAIAAIGLLSILIALVYYIIGSIKTSIKHNQAKTMLLTSNGMQEMRDEIIKLLQKPAYDVTVAFVTTAAKAVENLDYVRRDLDIMNEMGFNVEEVDIEGKNDRQLMNILQLKDIIYIEGGNTFYLLKAMRACGFEKVIRKLLKRGVVYMGASAGSVVVGKTIATSGWKNPDKNTVRLKNLKGLHLVPFDIFVHYQPEHAELIKQKMPDPKKRAKNLRILTDSQAILVQGKEIDLIGDGEAVII